jgi:hypothetical protein
MFHQRINGEEVEEEEAEEWESVDEEEQEEEEEARPDAAYMAQKLVERGITFEDLIFIGWVKTIRKVLVF